LLRADPDCWIAATAAVADGTRHILNVPATARALELYKQMEQVGPLSSFSLSWLDDASWLAPTLHCVGGCIFVERLLSSLRAAILIDWAFSHATLPSV
jgi:hypothetical protein